MRSLLYIYILIVMLLTTNCMNDSVAVDSDGDSSVGVVDSVVVGLGCSFSQKQVETTRMSVDATQDNEVFRGIEGLYLIPFATKGTIGVTDTRLWDYLELGHSLSSSSLISNNNAVYYEPLVLPYGTASFLVYAHAPAGSGSAKDKFEHGTLGHGFDAVASDCKPEDISFALEPIYATAAVPTAAQGIAKYLTNIATTSFTSPDAYYGDMSFRIRKTINYSWRNFDSYELTSLKTAFLDFVNNNMVMSGSSALLNKVLSNLYNALYPIAYNDDEKVSYYASNITGTETGSYYPNRRLATLIRSAIADPDYVLVTGGGANVSISLRDDYDNYPSTIYLPDGAAGIQWSDENDAFVVRMQTTPAAKIMSINRFCYPPILCYYGNSPIKTSDNDREKDHYISTNTWSNILGEYKSSSTKVVSTTRSVAICNPIEYSVGKLRVQIQCESPLADRSGLDIDVLSDIFPLTAVLVGQQHDVDYKFDPKPVSDEYTVYDREINKDKIYLRRQLSEKTKTLVFPTRKDEVVYVILEFRNESAFDFKGANGIIYKGAKFYMIAKLDPKDGLGYDADNSTLNRVFTKDHNTDVSFLVKNLKGAWSIIPDTRDPQLEIGVSMETKWIQSTTTNVKLD